LKEEFGTSKTFLEHKFKQPITTYAYPGGYHTEEMYPIAKELGYEYLFTVIPGKIKADTNNLTLPRYIILGTHDYIFKNAITFRNLVNQGTDLSTLPTSTPHPVKPVPATAVESRTPTISADLSKVSELDADSIVMRVAGFGKVPFTYNPETKICSWKVIRPLHADSVEVQVQWKINGETSYEPSMKWTFLIDKTAAYQPQKTTASPPE